MSILRLALAVAALALLPTSAALADPPWSAPITITAGIPAVSEPTIGFGASGLAVLSARLSTEANGFPSHGFTRLFGQQPGGGFVGRARLALAAPPAPYGSNRLALLRVPLAEGDRTIRDSDDPRSSLGYSYGRSGGPLEVSVEGYRRFTTQADKFSGTIAANARGDVIAAWVEHLSGRDHLVAAARRAGGAFGRPAVIGGTGFFSAVSAAVSPEGDLLVAYQRSLPRRGHAPDRRVEARVRRAGHNWSQAQRLGASSGFSEIATAATTASRMVVAWGTQDGGEEAGTPWIVHAALRTNALTGGFSRVQELERSEGIERPAGTVAAAIAPDGTATVAWSGITGTSFPHLYPARVATTGGGKTPFGAPLTLAPSAAVGDVAVDADGTALVVAATLPVPGDNQTSDQVFASLRPAGAAAFAIPELISAPERARLPQAAFNPVTHQPAVVWVSAPQGATQRLRYAARTG
jgi:hypothetical protein